MNWKTPQKRKSAPRLLFMIVVSLTRSMSTPGTSRGGGGVLPYKGLMGTCGQPGNVLRDFCLKQGIDIINFCLKEGIFSWTINSLRVRSTNALNRVSKIEILS